MNTSANETKIRELNWVDYADSLRRGASQTQIAAYVEPLAPGPVSIAKPAKGRQSGPALQGRPSS